jgi:hypothetical protein
MFLICEQHFLLEMDAYERTESDDRTNQGSILQNSISAISFFILKFSPTVTYII